MKHSLIKIAGTMAVLVTATAGFSACSSRNGGTSSSGITSAAKDTSGPTVTVDFVSGPSSDPFFSAMQKGAQDAADQQGAKLDYLTTNGSNVGPADFAQLIDTARAKHPDAMLVSDFFPSAMDSKIKATVGSGTPVILVNGGSTSYQADGALAFVGQDETQAGVAGAQQMLAAGVTFGLCINHVPGNPAVEARCTGFEKTMKAAGRQAKTITTPLNDGSDASAETQDIAGALKSNSGANGVFTLGSAIAADALAAVKQVSSKAKVGTCDISTALLNDVKSGSVLFAIDQQPYLQGYLAMTSAIKEVRYGLSPVGNVSTGPLVVNSKNVARVLSVNSKYPGVRGAS